MVNCVVKNIAKNIVKNIVKDIVNNIVNRIAKCIAKHMVLPPFTLTLRLSNTVALVQVQHFVSRPNRIQSSGGLRCN